MVSWDEVGALVALVFFWVLARRAKQRIKEESFGRNIKIQHITLK